MNSFIMNGILWRLYYVDPDTDVLIDREGIRTVATTDPQTHTIYVSNLLQGSFLTRVLVHELGHCAMISFGLIEEIRRAVKPEYWLEAEEWICNFIADYGLRIFWICYGMLGDDAWLFVPYELEKAIG